MCIRDSDTTGEKDFEEFFTDNEELDLDRFKDIGVIKNTATFDADKLDAFSDSISSFKNSGKWRKSDILKLYFDILTDFDHKDTGKDLDGRM